MAIALPDTGYLLYGSGAPLTTAELTVSAWLYRDTRNGWNAVFQWYDDVTGGSYPPNLALLSYNYPGIEYGALTQHNTEAYYSIGSESLPWVSGDGAWHHCAVAYDGNGANTVFAVDGVAQTLSANDPKVVPSHAGSLLIGSSKAAEQYRGKIAQLAFWRGYRPELIDPLSRRVSPHGLDPWLYFPLKADFREWTGRWGGEGHAVGTVVLEDDPFEAPAGRRRRFVFVATAATTLAAGTQAVVVSAPTATLTAGAVTLAAGGQAVVVTAPAATVAAGPVTLAAGAQAVAVSAPTATLEATVALAAGTQAVVVTAPTATLSVGAVTLAAGAQAVVVSAPTATLAGGAAVGLVVTIAGTDRSAYRRYGSLDIDQPLGGRASATLELIDTAASPYRPTLDQEVVIALNGAPIFGGYIRDLEDAPIIEPARGVKTTIALGDYGALCDQRIVFDKSYEAETLEDIVTDLWTDYLDVYGVTLTAMASSGPTITAQFSGQTLTAVFTQLQSLAAGWLWQITADKSLRWFEVGDDTGPALGSGDARLIHWGKASKDYANRVILSYGGDRSGDQDVIFTAADLTGGRYLLPYPLAAHGSVLFFWTTASETQADERPWGSWGDPVFGFSFDATSNEVIAPSFPSLAGFTFRFPYTTRFPIRITAEDAAAATNPVEVFVAAPGVTDATAAADLAAAILAERVASVPKTARVRTSLDGYAPGQQVAVSIPERSLSGTFLVTAVRTWHDRRVPEAADWLTYDLDLVEGTAQRRSWRDWWADIAGTAGGAGSAAIVASGALGITVYKELGGSKRAGHKNTSWAEIMEALDVWIDSALWSSVTVRARVKTANAATQVKIRLYNETTGAAASDESDWYDDTDFVPVELKVNLASGVNQYILQFKTDNTTWDVWVHAHLELYK